MYLKVDEGRRFLSFLFGLDLDFTADIYAAMRTEVCNARLHTRR